MKKKLILCMLTLVQLISFPAVAQLKDYTEQEFTISRIQVVDKQKKDGVQGILVNFNYAVKYGKKTIISADTSEDFSTYYLYLKIMSGNQLVYSPDQAPEQVKHQQTMVNYMRVQLGNPGKSGSAVFFIPYRKLLLTEGVYKLKMTIHACNEKASRFIPDISAAEMQITQPRLCINKLSLTDMNISFSEDWDVAGRSIPFWNLFYKSNSDNGRGYPDVQWSIKCGKDDVYHSGVHIDSHKGYDGSAVFYTAPGDPISIHVSDFDDFSFDDFIGKYNLPLSHADGQEIISELSFGDVTSVKLSYTRNHLPILISKKLSIDGQVKVEGVSGAFINLDYAVDQASDDFIVNVLPVFTYADGDIYMPVSDYEVVGSDLRIGSKNPIGRIRIFIPFYKFRGAVVPNFVFTYNDQQGVMCTTDNEDTLRMEIFNDAEFSKAEISEVFHQGVKGIQVTAKQEVPMKYSQVFRENLILKTELNCGNAKKLKFRPRVSCGSFNKKVTAFIPYFQLAGYNFYEKRIPLSIQRRIYIRKDDGGNFDIGEYNENYDLDMPPLEKVSFYHVEVLLKKKIDAVYCFAMKHYKDTLVMNEGVVKKKKIIFDINTNMSIYHPEDEITFLITDPDQTEKNLLLMSIKGKELAGMKDKNLKVKKSAIKKVKMQFVHDKYQ